MKQSLCKRLCNDRGGDGASATHTSTLLTLRNNLRNPYLNPINHYCNFNITETMRNTVCNTS